MGSKLPNRFRGKRRTEFLDTSESRDDGSYHPVFGPMMVGHSVTSGGPVVNRESIMGLTAAWNAVVIYGNSMGATDFYVAQQIPGQSIRAVGTPAPYHSTNRVLAGSPNPEMTRFKLRQALQVNALVKGNGYAEIEWKNRNRYIPKALHLMSSDTTKPFFDEWTGKLRYRIDGKREIMDARDIIHIAGPGFDGVTGYSPVALFRKTYRLAMSQVEHEINLMENNATPNGYLQLERILTREQKNKIQSDHEELHKGTGNAGKVGVLDGNMRWVQTSFSPADTELLLSREFSIAEISRIFNIPQFMLGVFEKANLTSLEQLNLQFFIHSLKPWIETFKQEFDAKLYPPSEENEWFTAFDATGFLRGDTAALIAWVSKMFGNGMMTRNEGRMIFGLAPVDGGDVYYIPANNLAAVGDDGLPIVPVANEVKPAVQPDETPNTEDDLKAEEGDNTDGQKQD